MSSIFQELKRRNVFRVSIAYVIVSWLLVQVVSTIREPLFLPEWTETLIIVILAIGFPIAVLFAWAFELTPDGIKKTEEVEPEESVTSVTGKKLNTAIIAALVLALAYFIFERQFLHDHGDEGPVEAVAVTEESEGTSIAVLPFADMSPDSDHEYFSDGISEELLNLLAKVPELRVAARTSSFQFKGQNLDITEVAEQLNVQHVLEGSVRKANTRVRITAQLIEADTGYHVWSDTYDRELVDVFGIQDEISAAIVAALSETLGLAPDNAPQTASETNPDAYDAYLLGQHLIKKRTRADIEAALQHFEKSVDLDPDYAPAHAQLALAAYLLTSSPATYGTFTLDESLSIAEPAIERALELDPNHAEANAIRGVIFSAKLRIDEAIEYFEKALASNPSLTDVRNWYSLDLEETGRAAEAFEIIKDAYAVDPLSVLTLNNYLVRLGERRLHDEMEPVIARLEQLDPARAANFRAQILNDRRRLAEAVLEGLRGADLNPGAARMQSAVAFGLDALGLKEEARRIWPFPNAEIVFADYSNPERLLSLAKDNYEKSPGDPNAKRGLAWFNLLAGNHDEALRWASEFLDDIDESRRDRDAMNQVFAFEAWLRDDQATIDKYLAPLEEVDRADIDAGLDMAWLHWGMAGRAILKGDEDAAAEAMQTALSREAVTTWDHAYSYHFLRMDENPRFAAIMADYQTYIAEERRKFLGRVCGEISFASWTPAESTCAEVEKSSPVPL